MNRSTQDMINVLDFGASIEADAATNGHAFRDAEKEARATGKSIVVPATRKPFEVDGDITLDWTGATLVGGSGSARINFSNGGLRVTGSTKERRTEMPLLADLMLSRSDDGTPGPVIHVFSQAANNQSRSATARAIRWSWRNVHIDGSEAQGILCEGLFLASIHGLWIRGCKLAGLEFRREASGKVGGNAISVHGGEIQACQWGILAEDTKAITLHGFSIEGCRHGALWLKSDNRNFGWYGGYLENNANQPEERLVHCDIRVGVPGGKPNRQAQFHNLWMSDGQKNSPSAVWIEDGQQHIDFYNVNFWAYARAPIQLATPDTSTASGRVVSCSALRPDEKTGWIVRGGGTEHFREH